MLFRSLADVDPWGRARDPRRPGESALAGLASRSPNLPLPLTPHDADKALRAAGHALATLSAAPALQAGVTPAFLAALEAQWSPAEVDRVLTYLASQGPLTVRANRLVTTRAALDLGVATVPVPDLPDALICLESARLTRLLAFHQEIGRAHV